MDIKLKKQEEILKIILFKMFYQELVDGKICATDQIHWIIKDKENMQRRFYDWLKKEGYTQESSISETAADIDRFNPCDNYID